MQIHELNNYSGSLDSSAQVVVDNGFDTGKLSVPDLLKGPNDAVNALENEVNADVAALNNRIDNIIAGGDAPSEAEIIDARQGVNGQTYASLGTAIRTQASGLIGDISEITVSDNLTVNEFIKELVVIGLNAEDISGFSVSIINGEPRQLNFKDSNNQNIAEFTITNANRKDVGYYLSVDGTVVIVAKIDWNKSSLFAAYTATNVTFNPVIESVQNWSSIKKYMSDTSLSVIIPTYTKTSSYRINTSGTIVSAGSNWFYTSPIKVYPGDVVHLESNGNVNAAPISYTDDTGSFYTMAVSYGGTEPSYYALRIEEEGYIAISGYTDITFMLLIYRDTYAQKIIDSISVASESSAIDINKFYATDYGLKVPEAAEKADTTSITGWTPENGAVLSYNKKYDNINREFKDCVTIESASGNGFAWFDLPNAVDATTHPLMVSVCVGEYDDTNLVAGNVGIELFSGVGRTSEYKMTYVFQGSSQDADYNPAYNHNGWFNFCIFAPSIPVAKRTINGVNFDPTSVTAVGVHLYNSRGIAVKAHVAELAFVSAMQKPGIVTIIDNFGTKVPDMADYAYSKGVRLNLSIIPGYYAGAPGAPICASKEELDRIAAQGHCIWNHTWTHQILNNLTYPEIQDQVNLAEKWMMLNGYKENMKFISNPSARFNTASYLALTDSNAEMIFHKWSGMPFAVFVPYKNALRCIQTTLLDQEVSGVMSASDIADVAEKAMTYGGITVMGFHDTYWNLDNGDSWKAYIDAIAAINDVYHYGLDEIYNGMWC